MRNENLVHNISYFFESYNYPVFLLYCSEFQEDVDLTLEWTSSIESGEISSPNYGFDPID